MGRRNHVLDGGQHRTNPFVVARDNKSAMQPFAKLLWTLIIIIIIIITGLDSDGLLPTMTSEFFSAAVS